MHLNKIKFVEKTLPVYTIYLLQGYFMHCQDETSYTNSKYDTCISSTNYSCLYLHESLTLSGKALMEGRPNPHHIQIIFQQDLHSSEAYTSINQLNVQKCPIYV